MIRLDFGLNADILRRWLRGIGPANRRLLRKCYMQSENRYSEDSEKALDRWVLASRTSIRVRFGDLEKDDSRPDDFPVLGVRKIEFW